MKNLTIILLGVAMVAFFSFEMAHAKPSHFFDMPADASNHEDMAQPEAVDNTAAVQELAAALTKNLVNMASHVVSSCPGQKNFYGMMCGGLPMSVRSFSLLNDHCRQQYRTLVEYHCPLLPKM
eukprot:scpid94332/ scgid8600/ 